jgi:hypothetical protein
MMKGQAAYACMFVSQRKRGPKTPTEIKRVYASAGGSSPPTLEKVRKFFNLALKHRCRVLSGVFFSTLRQPTQAVTFLGDKIDMKDKVRMVFRNIPVLLGHGIKGEKVAIEIGREAKTCLELLGADIQMVEYEGLGHWYSDKMLGDIFDFLRGRLRIEEPQS